REECARSRTGSPRRPARDMLRRPLERGEELRAELSNESPADGAGLEDTRPHATAQLLSRRGGEPRGCWPADGTDAVLRSPRLWLCPRAEGRSRRLEEDGRH